MSAEPSVMLWYDPPRQPMVKPMTESHKRPYRHPKYKTAYRVNNWRNYDQALRDRGNVPLWLTREPAASHSYPQEDAWRRIVIRMIAPNLPRWGREPRVMGQVSPVLKYVIGGMQAQGES